MASLLDLEIQDTIDTVNAERFALANRIIERVLAGEQMLAVVHETASQADWSVFELTLSVAEQLARMRPGAVN